MLPYPPEIEAIMRQFYRSLSEKDRRRYAGLAALKYGPGGQSYIARVLDCSRRTVRQGAQEVSDLPPRAVDQRIRQVGGGRKSYQAQWAEIDAKFLLVLRDHTAGDPMDERVRWTDLTWADIGRALREDHGIQVSTGVVRQLLHKHGYRRRQAQKRQTMQDVPHRNIAHYPPYCSKYNPIEHRLFPHVTRACQGVIFTTIELVQELMAKTHTQTGLQAFVHIIDKVYQTSRAVAADFKEHMRIVFDEVLPQWNYRAIPLAQTPGQVI